MNDLLETARTWIAAGERVVMATVVRVDGSAPRAEGAKMLIAASGAIDGSVSGGCVEAAVADEARSVHAGGPARVVRYGINRTMMWDVGLACGGEIDVLVEPLPEIAVLERFFAPGAHAALCTSLASGGSDAATKAIVFADGGMTGSLGDAALDGALASAARAQIESGASKTVSVGGRDVFVDVAASRDRLIVVGAVHIAVCLCTMAAETGFAVSVIDPRQQLNNRERFPAAAALLVGWPEDELPNIQLDEHAYVAILTHDEKFDDPSLEFALRARPRPRYIGAIGSRKTHAARRERLISAGFARDVIDGVHAPIGLDIGAQSPEEIAVAILAEMIATKYGHRGAALRDRIEPQIHS
jgi:xanthine dehydrogenase accessory factor